MRCIVLSSLAFNKRILLSCKPIIYFDNDVLLFAENVHKIWFGLHYRIIKMENDIFKIKKQIKKNYCYPNKLILIILSNIYIYT